MSVNYPVAVINARLTDVANAIDAGGAAGACRLYDSASTLISTLTLGFPSGAVAGGVLTFTGAWVDNAAVATGAPVSAIISDSNGNQVITGLTVGTGSSAYDIVLSNATITAGQSVAITPASITGR